MRTENQATQLPDPPFYFPIENGRYEVKPGLYKFPYDFGQQLHDSNVFQIDSNFYQYRQTKLASKSESPGKYYCKDKFSSSDESTVNQFVINKLITEHPFFFEISSNNTGISLNCKLTCEIIHFNKQYQLISHTSQSGNTLAYKDGFDALACQVQEDISVLKTNPGGNDKIIALHLCLPNHWSAEDKIGQDFMTTHQPVPHMEQINRNRHQLIEAITHKGPFVRFAWGIATDNRLNHHPNPPPDVPGDQWLGRSFNPDNPELYLRVERQTLHAFPQARISLFTIKTYLYDLKDITQSTPNHISLLTSAIESMSETSLYYKGLNQSKRDIITWLTNQFPDN